MSNIIGIDASSENENLIISNQGTDAFLELLICAAETLERTERQEGLVSFLKDQLEVNRIAPRTAGFDIAEMPWAEESLTDDIRFLVRVTEAAARNEVIGRLPYELNREIVLSWVRWFGEMIGRFKSGDASHGCGESELRGSEEISLGVSASYKKCMVHAELA